ncbi:ankyrin repeat domain-containing protein [Candidatus Cardinium hertigii]|uniref:ankyrin repeat domain-containing protein n=2 Tax=Candidatus Cardinium TaxID=273135 RepID=UPI001FAB07B3|nr:ankyrin repeat domain-containing protein [Candidatus Cardinium hertigii]
MNLPGKSLMLISLVSVVGVVSYSLSCLIPDQSNAMSPHNGSLITPLPPISAGKTPHKPVSNLPSDHLDTIEDMLTAGKEKYGNDSSTDPTTTTEATDDSEKEVDLNSASTDVSTPTMTTKAPYEKPADPMVLSEKIRTDLWSNHWSLDRVKYWVGKGLNVNAKTEDDQTLLMYAITRASIKICEYLIKEKKANVNAQFNNNITTLMILVSANLDDPQEQEEKVNLLINNGADICIKTEEGEDVRSMTRESKINDKLKSAIIAKLDEVEKDKPCQEDITH